jgi:hypothetical protein
VKTDFLIGHGFSDQFALHVTHKFLIHGGYNNTIVFGLGFTYFTEAEAPANFITGVIPWLIIHTPVEGEEDAHETQAYGVGIGVGREFKKNWVVGIDGFWKITEYTPANLGPKSFGLSVHVSHLFY